MNFFTHHLIGDFRFPPAGGVPARHDPNAMWFTVGDDRYWMPLPLSFVLIGLFLWIAENIATTSVHGSTPARKPAGSSSTSASSVRGPCW